MTARKRPTRARPPIPQGTTRARNKPRNKPPARAMAEPQYAGLLDQVHANFGAMAKFHALFTTNANGLFDTYLAGIPKRDRQHHNCNACRHFIERYGGLVVIAEDGSTMAAVWPNKVPTPYQRAVQAVVDRVLAAKVTGVFYTSKAVLGEPVTGRWHHLAVHMPASAIYIDRILNPHQAAAAKREAFQATIALLNSKLMSRLPEARAMIASGTLPRAEKVKAQADWLWSLHVAHFQAPSARRANIVWRWIASAPEGFLHTTGGMLGTLLEDLLAHLAIEDIRARWTAKMDPLQYQRPQVEPAAATIAQAETLVAKLGIERSLARRFARVAEIEAIWRPTPITENQAGGVFGKLKAEANATRLSMTRVTMTWEVFNHKLFAIRSIEIYIGSKRLPMVGLLTAVHPEAPPILQWDGTPRNPASWYCWRQGPTAEQINLTPNRFHRVSAVAFKPNLWYTTTQANLHHGKGIIFLIDEARETRNPGSALFPEMLRSELHGVRAVIEAYSQRTPAADMETGTAIGILLDEGQNWNTVLKVTEQRDGILVDQEIALDRWE